MKKKNKVLLALVSLSLVTVCIISASFAWFIYNQNVRMSSNSNLEIGVGAKLEMSYYDESNDSWSDFQYGALVPSYNLVDVTSNGKDFCYPYNLDSSDQPVYAMLNIVSADRRGYYLEYYIKIRTSNQLDIYLSKNSFIKPFLADNAQTPDNSNLSTYSTGDTAFSANNIAGAARVSIGEVTRDEDGVITNEETKQIWIPNPRYELYWVTGVDGNREARFNLSGTREDSYGYLENDNDNQVIKSTKYTTKEYLSKYLTVGTLKSDSYNTALTHHILADPDTGLANDAKCLFSFTEEGTLQEKEMVIRIWIEGTDRESSAALNRGKIDYNIEFCGLPKKEESTDDVTKLQTIYANNQTGKLYFKNGSDYTELVASDNIQYSYNGIDWYDYSTGLIYYYNYADANQRTEKVFVRNKEKQTETRSSMCMLTLRDFYTNNLIDFSLGGTQTKEEIELLKSINVKAEDGKLYSIVGTEETEIDSTHNIEYSYDGYTWYDYSNNLPQYYVEDSLVLTTEYVFIRQKDKRNYQGYTICKLSLKDTYTNSVIYNNGGN